MRSKRVCHTGVFAGLLVALLLVFAVQAAAQDAGRYLTASTLAWRGGKLTYLRFTSPLTGIRATGFRPRTTVTNDIWLGGAGNWNNAALWSAGVPGSNSAVLIDNGNPVASTVTFNVNGVANTLTIDSGDALSMNNATVLTIGGGSISNAGTLSMNSTGNNTELVLTTNTTLSGGGTLTMSNNTHNFIFGNATAVTLTNQGTIQGAGNIGDGQMTLVNQGTINANQPSALTIQASGGTTNTGLLEATGGGTLGFTSYTVNNAGGTINTRGGAFSASNATINGGIVALAGGGMTNSTINGAAVTVGSGGDLQLNNGSIINGTLNNSATIETVSGFGSVLGNSVTNTASGVIKIDNNTGLSFQAGTISNAGTISLNSTGNNTELAIEGNVTLTGAGTLTLSNNKNNLIFGVATGDTLTNQQTIQGAGNIGDNEMTLVNSGLINANQSNPLTIAANGGTTNTGTLEATAGGTLGFSGTTVNNAGGTINTSGGTFSASNTTINGGTVTLTGGGMTSSTINGATVAVGGTGDLQLNNGVIENGTLNNSATIETVSGFGSVLGSSVTNTASGAIKIDNNTGLSFQAGTINNAGTISLNSSGNNTELAIDGNVTLTGAGSLTLSNKTQNLIFGAATGDTLTNQQTIQGAGNIGDNEMTLVNAGLINANQSNPLTIAANGGTTNTGTLEATAGGTLGFSGTTVNNAGGTINTSGGTFSASNTTINGGTVTLVGGGMTSSTINGATVAVGGTGDLQLNNGSIINGTLNNSATIETVSSFGSVLGSAVTNTASGAIKIDNNTGLSFQAGTINNAGTISLNSTGNNTELAIDGNVTLTGAGTLTLSNKTQNLIFGAATGDTLTNQQTIQGAGNIGDNEMTLVNAGLINANQSNPLTIAANGGTTNTGTLEATAGATLGFSGTTVNNLGGTINTSAGAISASNTTINSGTVTLAGGGMVSSTISGATVTVGGTGDLQLNNGSIINGTLNNSATIETVSSFGSVLGNNVTNTATGVIQIDNNTGLSFQAGTVSNAGTISLNSTGNNTELAIDGNVTLTGAGTLTLSNKTQNLIFGAATGDTLTNQQTIQGAGNIGDNEMTLVNSGLINANQSNPLTIAANGGTTNTGMLEATVGATLGFSGTTVNNGGGTIDTSAGAFSASNTTINGGTVTLAGGGMISSTISGATVTVGGTGDLQLNNGSIINGTLSNSATIETVSSFGSVLGGVTNTASGAIKIDNNTGLSLQAGTVNNAGTISLNSTGNNTELAIDGNVTLSGAGTVVLSNNSHNLIFGAATADTLTNQETIAGSGNIGNNEMTLVNAGTINANQSTALVIGANGGFNNKGTLVVGAGDLMQISTNTSFQNFSGTTLTGGGYNITGTLQFPNANIVTNNANITLNGAGSQILSSTNANGLANFAVNGSSGTFTLGPGRSFTTAANFTNNGKLVVGSGDTFQVAGSLTNFSGTTLTGGNYAISGTLQFGTAGSTSILTDSAQISLGAGGQIIDLGGNNVLAGLNLVGRTGSFALGTNYGTFTTAGRFTNNGVLAVGSGDSFVVNGSLTNFAGGTLTGGTFDLTGALQFNNAAIVTNAANLTLSGGSIVNQSGANALLGLTTNTGTFALSKNASFATTGGSFTNSGTFTVNTGSTFTVGGSSFNFTQTAGTTTVDGTLTSSSLGSVNLNGGSLFGAGTLADNVVDSATLTPGDSATKTAKLTVADAYTQSAAGALNISIGGTGVGTTYDQLKVTQTASLGGTLNLSLVNGFTPAIGETFVVVSSSALSGTFATVNGLAINSSEHFTITYGGSNVILKVVSGALPVSTFNASAAVHPGLLLPGGHGAGGRGRYTPAVSVRRIVAIPAPALAPGLFSGAGMHGFHRMDETAAAGISDPSVAAAPGAASSLGLATISALSYNGMAAMNHKRFECGVDLKALLKTSRKQLLRGLWASPDSPDALNLGYMVYTGSH